MLQVTSELLEATFRRISLVPRAMELGDPWELSTAVAGVLIIKAMGDACGGTLLEPWELCITVLGALLIEAMGDTTGGTAIDPWELFITISDRNRRWRKRWEV